MALNIQEINGSDGLPQSRKTTNSNFSVLKNAVEALNGIVNTENGSISGVYSVSVSNSALSLLSIILNVANSATIAGSLSVGTENNATGISVLGTGSVTITNGNLTLGAGNITLSNNSSTLDLGGTLIVNGMDCRPGISNAFSNNVDASVNATIDVTGRKYLVVTNPTTGSVNTALTSPLTTNGQIIDIVLYNTDNAHGSVKIGGVKTFGQTNTTNVELKKSGDSIRVVFEGNSWYLIGAMSVSLLTGANSIVLS